MLAFNMAKNKYMPHMYMEKGDRLGYSNGILTLAIGAIVLLWSLMGKTESLIPLYTIGVFIPFAPISNRDGDPQTQYQRIS